MTALLIKDLSIINELDRNSMRTVRGGMMKPHSQRLSAQSLLTTSDGDPVSFYADGVPVNSVTDGYVHRSGRSALVCATTTGSRRREKPRQEGSCPHRVPNLHVAKWGWVTNCHSYIGPAGSSSSNRWFGTRNRRTRCDGRRSCNVISRGQWATPTVRQSARFSCQNTAGITHRRLSGWRR